MPITLTPITTGAAEGYYVKRAKVVATAGQDNFDLGFNLDNTATVADEDIAQGVFDLGDRYVDSRCIVLGVAADAGATAPHYLATTNAIFDMLGDWASRWARAQGYLLRGSRDDNSDKAEGQMAKMKDEAEKRIDELLYAAKATAATDAGTTGIEVIMPACCSHTPCGTVVS
jgi:hypothetical protein